MTTFSDGVFQYGGMPVGGLFSPGKALFVRPSSGGDGQSGRKPTEAIKTLAKGLALATANAGDVVYMIAEGNASASTTDYQSTALDWNKDGTHLIGVNSGNAIAQRSRIAQTSTATNVDNLFTVSANNCRVENIHVFHGVDDATSKGAVLVSGDRNHFVNCHFAGIGHATMDTADNYTLQVTGDENLFERCVIGLDTIARGTAANYEMVLAGGATRNIFRDCIFVTYAEANTHLFLKIAANGIDRFTMFERCTFINMPTGDAAGTTMTEAFDITGGGSPDGIVILNFCTLVGATDWEAASVSGKVMIRTDAGTAATAGLVADVAAS